MSGSASDAVLAVLVMACFGLMSGVAVRLTR